MKSVKIKVIELQLGIGLNMFFPEFKNLIFTEDYRPNKVLPVNASFGDKYKSVAKSAKNKSDKL